MNDKVDSEQDLEQRYRSVEEAWDLEYMPEAHEWACDIASNVYDAEVMHHTDKNDSHLH